MIGRELVLLNDRFAIARLDAQVETPVWANAGEFVSVTRTREELSIVCSQSEIPQDIQCNKGWRCLRIVGPIGFGVVGVLASIAEPIAAANISLFAISTFDTDYVLVREPDLDPALQALRERGHTIR